MTSMINSRVSKPHLLICVLIFIMLTMCLSSAIIVACADDNNDFFFNQLSDQEKEIYEWICCATEDNSTYTTAKESWNGFDSFCTSATRAHGAALSDNPRLRFIWARYTEEIEKDNEYEIRLVKAPYTSSYLLDKTDFVIQTIVDRVQEQSNDRYTAVRALTEIMWQETQYDPSWATEGKLTEMDNSALGVFAYGQAVCAGFADAAKILCDELNIPCIIVGNNGHAWNLIQMEDGNWYSLDLSARETMEYTTYMLLGDQSESYLNNSNYHLGEMYISQQGDFTFPDLAENSYEYSQDYTFEYTSPEKYQEPEGVFLYQNNNDGTCTITGYEGESQEDLVIPTTIDNLTVTNIGSYAFLRCNGFTGNIIIPNTVVTIEAAAFQQMENIRGTIVFSEGLERIGDRAFAFCRNITGQLSFPNTLKSIGNNAFYLCESITGDIRLPNSIDSIGDFAFYWCTGLDGTIYLPDTLSFNPNIILDTKIHAIAANETNNYYKTTTDGLLVSKDGKSLLYVPGGKTGDLVIPEGIEIIEENACSNQSNTRNLKGYLVLPTTVKQIKERAFMNHTFSGNLVLPQGLEKIGNDAFSASMISTSNGAKSAGFTGDLMIPDSVKSIGVFTFSGNEFGGTLHISSSMSSIPTSAFSGCSFNDTILIPGNIRTIGYNAFAPYNSSDQPFRNQRLIISEGVTTIESRAFWYFSGSSIQLPQSLTVIDEEAFYGLMFVENVEIPEKVTYIGPRAFAKSEFNRDYNLKSMVVRGLLTEISDEEGQTLGAKDETTIYAFLGSTAEEYASKYGFAFEALSIPQPELYLPSDLITIEENAFEGIASQAVLIPQTVAVINGNPFEKSSVKYIYGYAGTVAELFANDYGYIFVALDDSDQITQ